MQDDCIFCKIAAREDSQYERVIFENDIWQALLVSDPQTYGHFIVYPKKHFESLEDMGNQLAGDLASICAQLAQEKMAVLEAGAYYLHVNNGVFRVAPSPIHVGHIHMHVVPRYSKDDSFGGKRPDEHYFGEVITKMKGGRGTAEAVPHID